MAQIFALPFESGYFRPHHKYNGQLHLNNFPKYQGESLTTFKGQETEKIAIYSKDLIVELKKKNILSTKTRIPRKIYPLLQMIVM